MAAISSGHAKAPNCVTIYDDDRLDWISIDQNTSRFRSWSISVGFKIDWVKRLPLAKDFVERKLHIFGKNIANKIK